MPDVLAIGNAIVDVIAPADEAFLLAHGLVKGSMQLVDADRAEVLYAAMATGVETSGGSAANTAVGVASLGGTAAFVGKVRDDPLGHVYVRDLRAVGVDLDVAPAPADDPEPTGRCLILVTADAERTMSTSLGIAARVGPDDIDAELVASTSVVFAEGYLWDSPPGREAITKAMALARAAGRLVAFSLSDGFCVDRHRAGFRDLVAGAVDVLFANDDEVRSLYEVDDFDAAVAKVGADCRLAFVTRGERGSVAVTPDGVHEVDAVLPGPLVDTTGAGDLYAAGVLHALCQGADPATAGRLGSLAAGEVITHVGPRPLVSLRQLADAAGLP